MKPQLIRLVRLTRPVLLAAGLLAGMHAPPASADEDIVGVSSVIDGDTIDIHGERIRFFGIDAPESSQTCSRGGVAWRCGADAAHALSDFLGRAVVRCRIVSNDKYGRHVGVCDKAGQEINRWAVENGWALDWDLYSKGAYASAQDLARNYERGIWNSEFQPPWEYRQAHRR